MSEIKKVVIQGFRASFHEVAANKFFGSEIRVVMADTFRHLFNSIAGKEAGFGVVAIENTVAGTILPNYALLRNSNTEVIGEVYLQIQQNLMALPGQKIKDIREVRSHPMAILQCHDFLEENPHIQVVESVDTALSAAEIREKNLTGIAAIAGIAAAELYNLDIIAESIETNKKNFTRFLVIKDKDVNYENGHDKTDKASICFHLAHRTGSLASILTKLATIGVNLTKIQSLPLLGREWEYFFHLDLEYDDYGIYQKALEAISPDTHELQVLGEYKRGLKYS